MYKTLKHMGKIGDVIYSLPTIRELGGGILYIPENTPDACTGMYSALKDLLLQQPYIREVREYPSGLPYKELAPGIHIDYDLDLARNQPMKGVIHIVKRYLDTFGIDYPGWKEPWLSVPGYSDVNRMSWHQLPRDYILINYTGRHIHNDKMNITSIIDWQRVAGSIELPKFFVGHADEYMRFCERYDVAMPFIKTDNMLQLARIIKGAHSVYCNQSSVLALSQSLGKTYYLDVKPQKTNCLLYTSNENILL